MDKYNLNKSEFGSFVSILRKEKGITQKELAQQLFVSDKAVSKWETGQSIPDVALLIPLAEILGVSVTELLECRRIENIHTMPADDVEKIVKKAVSYKDSEKRTINKKWIVPYSICLVIAIVQIYWLRYVLAFDMLMATLMVPHILSVIFGACFCLFARKKLPDFYDENRISFMSDGILRMNIPGVNFNNSNWPNIVGYIRLWCIVCMLFMPAIFILSFNAVIDVLFEIGLYTDIAINTATAGLSVAFLLFTLVIPVYFIGKKYE